MFIFYCLFIIYLFIHLFIFIIYLLYIIIFCERFSQFQLTKTILFHISSTPLKTLNLPFTSLQEMATQELMNSSFKDSLNFSEKETSLKLPKLLPTHPKEFLEHLVQSNSSSKSPLLLDKLHPFSNTLVSSLKKDNSTSMNLLNLHVLC